jgi:hypothetical protein
MFPPTLVSPRPADTFSICSKFSRHSANQSPLTSAAAYLNENPLIPYLGLDICCSPQARWQSPVQCTCTRCRYCPQLAWLMADKD